MNYYSTNNNKLQSSLKKAVLTGMPADKGLYMPMKIKSLAREVLENLSAYSFQEISKIVCKQLIDDVDESVLDDIIDEAITFDAPLISLTDTIATLELFHGPTLAFKDFGARFMSRLMSYFMQSSGEKLTIVVATSGDTGSAVANGFYEVDNIKVVVLYPSGKVSSIQEKQIATLGKNIIAVEVAGTFDDCQQMVKQALVDDQLQAKINITSANSINISRLIPQVFYYFHLYAQLDKSEGGKIAVAVPSGNLGNLTAGLMAQKMGLPIDQFIAATNINDVVPEYLETGQFAPRPSVATISNAMDVGNPSNFARILELYDNDYERIHQLIKGYAFTDDQTREKIKQVFADTGYICDPHGAVGYSGLAAFLAKHPDFSKGIFLETAHPAKFNTIVENELNQPIEIPKRLSHYLEKEKTSVKLNNDYRKLQQLILEIQ